MKYYLAPIDGVTNVFYRKLHNKYYKGIDKYYIPFLVPSLYQTKDWSFLEILPENNKLTTKAVPQIVSKDIDETVWMIKLLEGYGYDEINLNFGCPSGTVVPKGKGAGMLKDLSHLDNYLNAVTSSTNAKISIKIRLGLKDITEFDSILPILNKYSISELIIHPRTASEKYSGPIHYEALNKIHNNTSFDIIYNGEIKNKEDILYIEENYPFIKGIMIGRGIIEYPDLLQDEINKKETFKSFFTELANESKLLGDKEAIYYLKTTWKMMKGYFENPDSILKELLKTNDYNKLIELSYKIIDECKIIKAEEK